MSGPSRGTPPHSVPIEYRAASAELTRAQIVAEIVWLSSDLCWCVWPGGRLGARLAEWRRRETAGAS